ncbi:uncharacterized protein [Dysidea avara]|uniref:uncharacterized protein isoform X2 n=1 Tax=Dysidea avara TaxID=196820 RepID=UPI00331EBAF5
MNPRKTIIKRKSIPLTLVSVAKRCKIKHIKAPVRSFSDPPLVEECHFNTDDSSDQILDENNEGTCYDDQPDTEQQTAHTKRKQKAAEKWQIVQSVALNGVIMNMSEALLDCTICDKSRGIVKCDQCGPLMIYCKQCAIDMHQHSLFHHFVEVWEDGYFQPLELPDGIVLDPKPCCENITRRSIVCFSVEGSPRVLNFPFCSCKCDALKLIGFNYWPGTPVYPQVAFTFEFLDLLEALLLECHVAVQDFTQAWSYLVTKKLIKMPCNLYPVLIDSFEEYRHFRRRLQTLEGIHVTPLDHSCPACSTESGVVTVSIDAIFGLCRKKSAGKSVQGPLSGKMVFEFQDEVNAFVSSHSQSRNSSSQGLCNNFLAGNELRSSKRYKALDETAVMGSICRHEVPLRFFNLFHGERISYAVYMMHCLQQLFPSHDIKLLYDVSCTLQKHLQANSRDDLLSVFHLAIPIFHCFGHKLSCQIQFSPRIIEGFGLSDGEGMERMWSFLRPFSRMTKEMGPSHRIDVLSDAILYYGQKGIDNIGKLICKKFHRAQSLKEESNKDLNDLMLMSPVQFSMADVERWEEEERSQLLQDSSAINLSERWQAKYVKLIDMHEEIKSSITSISTVEPSSPLFVPPSQLLECLTQCEDKLKSLEQANGVRQRWSTSSTQYREAKTLVASEHRMCLLLKLEQAARERWFLLTLKAKYADGLAIDSRLSLPVEDHMIWEAAINIHRNSYTASLASIATSIPIEVKREAVQKFRTAKRSLEEIALLKDEMRNCLEYYKRQIASLKRSQEEIHLQLHEQEKDVEKLSGCYCLISRKLLIFSTKLTDLLSLFRNIVPEVIPPSMGTSEASTENHFPLTSYTAHVSISIQMKLMKTQVSVEQLVTELRMFSQE